MALAPVAKLGPYEILAPLGVGGMGEVYRARDTRLDRVVAIKILPAQLSSDPAYKQRFEREAKTVSHLNHPHICVLHDVGHQEGIDYLVTEQGTIVGTFQYMSPEQVEGKEVDGRSDIFSLGAVLYEILTGQRAFEGKSQLSTASAILEKEPTPISAVKPMTPPALEHTIK